MLQLPRYRIDEVSAGSSADDLDDEGDEVRILGSPRKRIRRVRRGSEVIELGKMTDA